MILCSERLFWIIRAVIVMVSSHMSIATWCELYYVFSSKSLASCKNAKSLHKPFKNQYICSLYKVTRNQMTIKLLCSTHMHTHHVSLAWLMDTLKLKINLAVLLPEENRNFSQMVCIIFQAAPCLYPAALTKENKKGNSSFLSDNNS